MEKIVGIKFNVTRMKVCRVESTKCIYIYRNIFRRGHLAEKREWGRETISLVVEVTYNRGKATTIQYRVRISPRYLGIVILSLLIKRSNLLVQGPVNWVSVP